MPDTPSIRVVIVDDHQMVRSGIRNMLSIFHHIEIIAEYEKGSHLLAGFKEQTPDILLLDLQLPDNNGETLLPIIQRDYPQVKTIILTSNENMYNVKMLLSAGANGYLFKNADGNLLVEAIEHVYHHPTPFLTPQLQDNIKRKKKEAGMNLSLTQRETDVLRLIAKELTSQEIGAILQINYRTVEIYRQGIMQKLEVKNMVGMVKKAIMLGVISE